MGIIREGTLRILTSSAENHTIQVTLRIGAGRDSMTLTRSSRLG